MNAVQTKPRNRRQEIWAYLRTNRHRFATVDETAQATDNGYVPVYHYLNALYKAGYLSVQPNLFGRQNGYRLEKDGGTDAPRLKRDGSTADEPPEETVWRTMKILHHFTLPSLVRHVCAARPISGSLVMRYADKLEAAGYLKRGADDTLILVKNTGAKAPRVMTVVELYDPNLNETTLREVPDYE